MSKGRTYAYGMRIGRMTNDANMANLLSQASTELAKASAHYRRADDEMSPPHKRANREAGLGQARLGMRFVFQFMTEERVDIADEVATFIEATTDDGDPA